MNSHASLTQSNLLELLPNVIIACVEFYLANFLKGTVNQWVSVSFCHLGWDSKVSQLVWTYSAQNELNMTCS